jgi:hypothetical protein
VNLNMSKVDVNKWYFTVAPASMSTKNKLYKKLFQFFFRNRNLHSRSLPHLKLFRTDNRMLNFINRSYMRSRT